MADVIYIKYNRTRKEEFQIKTEILEENGTKWVENFAAAFDFVKTFSSSFSEIICFSSCVSLRYAV